MDIKFKSSIEKTSGGKFKTIGISSLIAVVIGGGTINYILKIDSFTNKATTVNQTGGQNANVINNEIKIETKGDMTVIVGDSPIPRSIYDKDIMSEISKLDKKKITRVWYINNNEEVNDLNIQLRKYLKDSNYILDPELRSVDTNITKGFKVSKEFLVFS